MVAWEEYREIVQTVRDLVSKAEVLTEVNLAKDIQGTKKSLFRHTNNKRNTRENKSSLRKDTEVLVTRTRRRFRK